MRLAVYTDYVFRQVHGVTYAERAFALFLAALSPSVEHLRLVGRLDREASETPYPLPREIELAPLAHYRSLANPAQALRSLAGSIRQMSRALEGIDVVWVLGPYPHAIALVAVALIRRRRVVLGVRQDWPRYVRMRRPGRRWMHLSADALEAVWRGFARWLPVVAVGPELSATYAHAPAQLELAVSLVPEAAVGSPARARDYSAELRVLSVGRLDQEKNPLMLADVLAALCAGEPRWRLVVCGQGDLQHALAERLEQLGVRDRAELRGYVPMGEELWDIYRSSSMLLHVSLTEGFPQVLIEAFASGLPIVATAVGGVAEGVADAALLVPPGDPDAAVIALRQLASDPTLRARLTAAGLKRARGLTLEAQTARLLSFLEAADRPSARALRPAS